MKKLTKKRWLALALLIILCGGVGWACWPDGRVARAKELRKELFTKGARLTADQRKEKWQELRTLQKQLTPAQRQELSAESRKRRQAEMGRYFAMTPKEKERHLDSIIRRQEQMRKSQQARAGQGGSPRAGGPASKSDRSPKGRDDRRQRFLDVSTPAERAQVAQFRKDLNDRRARLGVRAGAPGSGRTQ